MKTTPTGSYVGHDDSYFPSLVQVERIEDRTYLPDEALQLASWVAERFAQLAIHGPSSVQWQSQTHGEDTHMSPEAIQLSKELHIQWIQELNKPVPSQEFPLKEAA